MPAIDDRRRRRDGRPVHQHAAVPHQRAAGRDGVHVAGDAQGRADRPSESTSTRPLSRVQSWSDVPRGTPLFETLVVFEKPSARLAAAPRRAARGSTAASLYQGQTNYPVTLVCYADAELVLRLEDDRQALDGAESRSGCSSTCARLLKGLAKDGHRRARRRADARRGGADRIAAGSAAVGHSDVLPARTLRAARGRDAARAGADLRRPDADLRRAQPARESAGASSARAAASVPTCSWACTSNARPSWSSRFSGF